MVKSTACKKDSFLLASDLTNPNNVRVDRGKFKREGFTAALCKPLRRMIQQGKNELLQGSAAEAKKQIKVYEKLEGKLRIQKTHAIINGRKLSFELPPSKSTFVVKRKTKKLLMKRKNEQNVKNNKNVNSGSDDEAGNAKGSVEGNEDEKSDSDKAVKADEEEDENSGSDDEKSGSAKGSEEDNDDEKSDSDKAVKEDEEEDENSGSDDEKSDSAKGSEEDNDDEKSGSDDQKSGSEDEKSGSDDEKSDSDDEKSGIKDEKSGSKDEKSGIKDEKSDSNDEKSGSDDEKSGSTNEKGSAHEKGRHYFWPLNHAPKDPSDDMAADESEEPDNQFQHRLGVVIPQNRDQWCLKRLMDQGIMDRDYTKACRRFDEAWDKYHKHNEDGTTKVANYEDFQAVLKAGMMYEAAKTKAALKKVDFQDHISFSERYWEGFMRCRK